jgi:alpha-beta hydrolase superfamily lysophospholipase
VSFSATDGTPLVGMLYEPATRPAPGVVLVHMLGRSKDEWAPIAERLQNAGLVAVAIDLRGHGRSGGNGSELAAMIGDVEAAAGWLAAHPSVRPHSIAIVGASLGANLAALAGADSPAVRALALVSPSLDYRGLRLDAAVMKKVGDRPVWFAASTEDPLALRTVKELTAEGQNQRLSNVRAHGTPLIAADPDLAAELVDWLRQSLIF